MSLAYSEVRSPLSRNTSFNPEPTAMELHGQEQHADYQAVDRHAVAVGSGLNEGLPLLCWPEMVNQFAQFLPVLLGKPFGPQQRRHQGNDGAVA
jgi:hypothetical protein